MLKRLSQILPAAKWLVQRWLVRRGLIFFRVPRTASLPPTISQYLQSLAARGVAAESVLSFDDEPQIQRELLSAFTGGQVTFLSLSGAAATASLFPELPARKPPAPPFLVGGGHGETYDVPELLTRQPSLAGAEIIMVRATLGYFWSGQGDLQSLVCFLEGRRALCFTTCWEYVQIASAECAAVTGCDGV